MTGSSLVGQTIGNYRIDAVLGNGGMGQVYRATHLLMNRPAAIKVMHANLASDPNFQARFVQEAKAAGALDHPNIVQIHDFGEENGRYYLVMELVTGGSLRGLLQKRAANDQTRLLEDDLDLVRQAADALAYAHLNGMVHRDIKPDNLMLQPPASPSGHGNYVVKVTDFGLAHLAEGGVQTATGITMGTPTYMSPEQCQGAALDGRSDIYSLGVVLYEVATSSPPFNVKSLSEAVHKHVYVAPPPPRQIRPDLPDGLEQIILRCLAKRPDDRYRTAGELSNALRAPAPGTARSTIAMTDISSNLVPPGPLPVGSDQIGTTFSPVVSNEPTPPMPTILNAGSRPRLQVSTARGEVLREIDLSRSGITVGRQAGNDVQIDDGDVSRLHLRIDWDGARVSVTDLGSSNGTSLGDSRLLPQAPQTWDSRDWVRVGSYWLRYQPATRVDSRPSPAATAGATQLPEAQPQLASTRFHVSLEQDRLELTPGQQSIVQVTLANMGSTVDHLMVSVEGVPAEWVKVPDGGVQLNPGTRAPLLLNVDVPRTPASEATTHAVLVRARSRENPSESAVAQTQWTVLPFTVNSLDMDPYRRRGRKGANFLVELRNDGNKQERFTLSGRDDERALDLRFEKQNVAVDAGHGAGVRLRVRSSWRWLGADRRHQFSVRALAESSSTPKTIAGEYVHKALIPGWLPPLVLACAAVAAVVVFRPALTSLIGVGQSNTAQNAAQSSGTGSNSSAAANPTPTAVPTKASGGNSGPTPTPVGDFVGLWKMPGKQSSAQVLSALTITTASNTPYLEPFSPQCQGVNHSCGISPGAIAGAVLSGAFDEAGASFHIDIVKSGGSQLTVTLIDSSGNAKNYTMVP